MHLFSPYVSMFVLVHCLVACFTPMVLSINLVDELALTSLKAHITYDSLGILATNWSTKSSHCHWYGISCNAPQQRVSAINLSSMGLEGTIAPQVGNLSFLVSLDLSNNYFHASLPEDIEYGAEGIVSTKGDTYSYGIILIETFARKKPTDEMFVGELTFKSWVESSANDIAKVIDVNLLKEEDDCFALKQACFSSIITLALDCTTESPKKRINMKDVVVRLKKILNQIADVNDSNRRRRYGDHVSLFHPELA